MSKSAHGFPLGFPLGKTLGTVSKHQACGHSRPYLVKLHFSIKAKSNHSGITQQLKSARVKSHRYKN